MLRNTILQRLGFYQRAVAMAPHPDKIERGGEDSFMLCDHAIAVADGVGEHFTKWGIDAGIYARSLTREAYDAAMEASLYGGSVDALELVATAEERSSAYRGTSTITLASIARRPVSPLPTSTSPTTTTSFSATTENNISNSNNTSSTNFPSQEGESNPMMMRNVLEVANIGDSSTMLLRNGKVIFKSRRMEHSTNHPFQIGNGTASTAQSAEVTQVEVQANDLVICASDGVTDNLFDCQIEALLERAALQLPMPADLSALIPEDYDFSHTASYRTTKNSNNRFTSDGRLMSEKEDVGKNVAGSTSTSTSTWYDTMTVQQLNTAVRTVVAAARENSLTPQSYTPYIQGLTDLGFDQQNNKLDDCTVVIAQVLESPSDVRVDSDLEGAGEENATNPIQQQGLGGGFMDNQGRLVMMTSGSSSIGGGGGDDALMPPDPYCGYP